MNELASRFPYTSSAAPATLRFRSLGMDAAYEHVVFVHVDCPFCRPEGFAAQTRIVAQAGVKLRQPCTSAPQSPAAGMDLHVHLDDVVQAEKLLFSIHAEAPGELRYALAFQATQPDVLRLEESR